MVSLVNVNLTHKLDTINHINNIEKEMREIYPPEELKTTLEEEKEAIEKAKTMSEAWIKIIDQKK